MTNTNKDLSTELMTVISRFTGYNMITNIKDRSRIFTTQRQIFALLLRNQGYTLETIAKSINKTTSAVLLYVKKANDLLYSDKEFKILYDLVFTEISTTMDLEKIDFSTDYQAQLNEALRKLNIQIEAISIIINELKNKK